jgi:hypothetical protein
MSIGLAPKGGEAVWHAMARPVPDAVTPGDATQAWAPRCLARPFARKGNLRETSEKRRLPLLAFPRLDIRQ